MDVKCRNARRLISRLVDGEPVAAVSELERHLAGCASCRGEVDALRRDRQMLAAAEAPALPPFLLTRVMAEVRQSRPKPELGLVATLRAGAALLVVTLGLGAGTFIGTQLAAAGATAAENGVGATEVADIDVYAPALGGGQ